jgi:hypothetical protein
MLCTVGFREFREDLSAFLLDLNAPCICVKKCKFGRQRSALPSLTLLLLPGLVATCFINMQDMVMMCYVIHNAEVTRMLHRAHDHRTAMPVKRVRVPHRQVLRNRRYDYLAGKGAKAPGKHLHMLYTSPSLRPLQTEAD